MRILLTGATGFIGKNLSRKLALDGHELVTLSRRPLGEKSFVWDSRSEIPPREALSSIDAVINLAGENVAQRWTQKAKEMIYHSRVTGTRNLISGINGQKVFPRVLISASAVGFYGDQGDHAVTEDSPAGDDFLARVCRDWEAEVEKVDQSVRRVILRIGLVLGNGGALSKMLPPFKLGLGGPVASGSQWMSWIHIDDLTSIIVQSLKEESMSGIFNAVSPHPVANSQFAKALGRAVNRPAIIPVPKFALRLAMGEAASMVLSSIRAVPERLEETGFKYKYSDIETALKSCLQ